jgi:hypothetical protein
MNKFEIAEFHKYQMQGTALGRLKPNEFNTSPASSIPHEVAKLVLFLTFRKLGHNLLTECQEKDSGRRVDIVDISTGESYEAETTPERCARFLDQPVNLIAVNWSWDNPKWVALKAKASKIRAKEFMVFRYDTKMEAVL